MTQPSENPISHTDIVFLTVAEVITLHDLVVRRHTPLEPRDILSNSLLESAAMQPRQSFDGQALYPTFADMASAYLVGLALNHRFRNGNKRIALAACSTFLRMNGYRLTFTQDEAEHLVLDLIAHALTREDAALMIASAVTPV